MTAHSDLSKVVFQVPEDDGSLNVETLWAVPLGNNLYRLDNSPFYAYSVSWKDIVYAEPQSKDDWPVFTRVVEKSGHRTVRVIFEKPVVESGESKKVLEQIVSLGCSCEAANPSYICIDIPPGIELEVVGSFLISRQLQFEYADPTYSELFPNEDG